jgi:hypothetical protein
VQPQVEGSRPASFTYSKALYIRVRSQCGRAEKEQHLKTLAFVLSDHPKSDETTLGAMI